MKEAYLQSSKNSFNQHCFQKRYGHSVTADGISRSDMETFPDGDHGSVCNRVGVLACLFPDTTGKKLPETIEDALNLG